MRSCREPGVPMIATKSATPIAKGTTKLADDIEPADAVHSLAEAAVQTIPANPVALWLIAKRGPAGAAGTTPPIDQRHRTRQTLAGRDCLRSRHRSCAHRGARTMHRPSCPHDHLV